MITFIMHSISGKTTVASKFTPSEVFDADRVRTPELEAKLRPLRDRRDWPAHNILWHAALREGVERCRPHVLLVHSLADAEAVGAVDPITLHPTFELYLELREEASRSGAAPERLELSRENRSMNRIQGKRLYEYESSLDLERIITASVARDILNAGGVK